MEKEDEKQSQKEHHHFAPRVTKRGSLKRYAWGEGGKVQCHNLVQSTSARRQFLTHQLGTFRLLHLLCSCFSSINVNRVCFSFLLFLLHPNICKFIEHYYIFNIHAMKI